MKFLQILLMVCAALSYAKANESGLEEIHNIANECKTATTASDDDVAHVFKLQPSNTHEEKCLRACVLQKIGILNDDAKLDKVKSEEIIKKIAHGNEEKEKIGAMILETCENIETPEDHCEAAEAYNECMLKVIDGKEAATLED